MLRQMTTAFAVVALGILLWSPTRAAEEPGQQAYSTQTQETAADKISGTATTAAEKVKHAAAVASREINDSWMTLKTKLSLLANKHVRNHEVHVATRQGIVTLRGKVRSEAARQAAVGDATKIDGVQRVESHLMVDSRATRKAIIGRMT